MCSSSLSVLGGVSKKDLPHVIMPFIIELSKPHLCHDNSFFFNLWMADCPFPLDNLSHVGTSYLTKDSCHTTKDLSSGVIYKINCKDCDKIYIGQTSRALRSRTREHKRAIFMRDKNSLLTQHCIKKKVMNLTLTMLRSLTVVSSGQKHYF